MWRINFSTNKLSYAALQCTTLRPLSARCDLECLLEDRLRQKYETKADYKAAVRHIVNFWWILVRYVRLFKIRAVSRES